MHATTFKFYFRIPIVCNITHIFIYIGYSVVWYLLYAVVHTLHTHHVNLVFRLQLTATDGCNKNDWLWSAAERKPDTFPQNAHTRHRSVWVCPFALPKAKAAKTTSELVYILETINDDDDHRRVLYHILLDTIPVGFKLFYFTAKTIGPRRNGKNLILTVESTHLRWYHYVCVLSRCPCVLRNNNNCYSYRCISYCCGVIIG